MPKYLRSNKKKIKKINVNCKINISVRKHYKILHYFNKDKDEIKVAFEKIFIVFVV